MEYDGIVAWTRYERIDNEVREISNDRDDRERRTRAADLDSRVLPLESDYTDDDAKGD